MVPSNEVKTYGKGKMFSVKIFSYVEAALSSIGVSSEQLVDNVAKRLRDDMKSIKPVPWPPRIEELE